MRSMPSLTMPLVLVVTLQGCAAVTGKTAGQTIDDATITATVKAKLADERLGTLTRVDVDTTRSVVYLNGVAESEALRERAAEIARRVSGVRGVVNNLQVQGTGRPPLAPPSTPAPAGAVTPGPPPAPAATSPVMSDAEITTAVKAKLAAEEPNRLVTVAVETRDGAVHLRGTVEDEAARERAAELARAIPGVREVINELKVPGA